jgi:NurA domain
VPLDLLHVSRQVRHMGDLLVTRRADQEQRLELARSMLREHDWQLLAERADRVSERVAVPTEPVWVTASPPPRPAAYTALATDGSEVDPDRHGGGGEFYVINLGRVRIPYGQPTRDVELRSTTRLGYADEDLLIVDATDPRRQVPMRDRHLDALRTVEEMRALAELAEGEHDHRPVPVVALVDGTLLFSVLEERPRDFLRERFYVDYVEQLERLRRAGVTLGAYASRSRGIDLVNLLRTVCGARPALCERCNGHRSACALRGLTDAHLIPPPLGARSALFRVRSNVHDPFYGPHRVYFFLLNVDGEVCRVELPEWVALAPERLDLVHATLVDQCAKGSGYPAVLARADDRAVVATHDRVMLDTLVRQELARRGVQARPSAKLGRKQVRTV